MKATCRVALSMAGIGLWLCSTTAANPARVDVVRGATGLGVDGAMHVGWGASSEGSGQVVVLDDKTQSKSTVELGRPCGRIGDYWLEGVDDSVGHSVIVYKNWHT